MHVNIFHKRKKLHSRVSYRHGNILIPDTVLLFLDISNSRVIIRNYELTNKYDTDASASSIINLSTPLNYNGFNALRKFEQCSQTQITARP